MTLLAILLTCCRTNRLEYIPFPEFPSLTQITRNADGTVTMPATDLIRLAEFRLKYDTLRETYGQEEKNSK